MRILYTAFKGKNNSSKVLLDNIKADKINKLYLTNSFKTSVEELIKKIKCDEYDLIIAFGQAPLSNNNIKIETKGKDIDYNETEYDYIYLQEKLVNENFTVIISEDAGNYLCNNIYYNGLKFINDKNLRCKMIFIHIPELENISDITKLSCIFNKL